MAKFSSYSEASSSEITEDGHLLMQTEDGDTRRLKLEDLKSTFLCNVHCASITITSAEVLALNTTPKEIVAAQGAGKAIEVISGFVNLDFNTTPYATNTVLTLFTNSITASQMSNDVLSMTTSRYSRFAPVSGSGLQNIGDNLALSAGVLTGDPTAGDSDIEIWVMYRVVEL